MTDRDDEVYEPAGSTTGDESNYYGLKCTDFEIYHLSDSDHRVNVSLQSYVRGHNVYYFRGRLAPLKSLTSEEYRMYPGAFKRDVVDVCPSVITRSCFMFF